MQNPLNSNNLFMKEAIKEALIAKNKCEVPVGAIAVKDGLIIARSHNLVESFNNIMLHAEINILGELSHTLKTKYFYNVDIYVTLEPCIMCCAAISNARIRSVYFGAFDEKTGAISGCYNINLHNSIHHKTDYYGGIKEYECSEILKQFFKNKR
jgi:tRNA(adenine34) deaminase